MIDKQRAKKIKEEIEKIEINIASNKHLIEYLKERLAELRKEQDILRKELLNGISNRSSIRGR